MSDDVKVSEYSEYRIACSDGLSRHQLRHPTNRFRALEDLVKVDRRRCSLAHTLEQRLIVKHEHPWGVLLATDPQSAPKEQLFTIAEQIACPKCEAGVGEPCINLRELRSTGDRVEVSWPHAERVAPHLRVGS